MGQFLNFGDGHDGDATPSGNINTFTSCNGTAASTTLTVASEAGFDPGDMVLIHQTRGTGVGAWEINKVISSPVGQLIMLVPLDNTYTDSGASQAQCLLMPQYSSATVSGTVTPTSWAGNAGGVAAFACSGKTTITGTVSVDGGDSTGVGGTSTSAGGTGGGFRGGQAVRGNTPQQQGEGTSGAGSTSTSANGNGGGGGTGGSAHAGGGGHSTAGGTGGGGSGGTGGGVVGSADLTTMNFGGGGGGGSSDQTSATERAGGGGGGGIVLILAKEFDVSSGSITVDGGDADSNSGGFWNGGGGAGGSVLIKSVNATLGTNNITAAAGTGNNGSPSGGVGRIRIEACTIDGNTNPAASEEEGGQDYCGSVAQILDG